MRDQTLVNYSVRQAAAKPGKIRVQRKSCEAWPQPFEAQSQTSEAWPKTLREEGPGARTETRKLQPLKTLTNSF